MRGLTGLFVVPVAAGITVAPAPSGVTARTDAKGKISVDARGESAVFVSEESGVNDKTDLGKPKPSKALLDSCKKGKHGCKSLKKSAQKECRTFWQSMAKAIKKNGGGDLLQMDSAAGSACQPITAIKDLDAQCSGCFATFSEWCGAAVDICNSGAASTECKAVDAGGAAFSEDCMKAIWASQPGMCAPTEKDGQVFTVYSYRDKLMHAEFDDGAALEQQDSDNGDGEDAGDDDASFVQERATLSSSTTEKGELRRRRAELRRRTIPSKAATCDYSR